MTVQTGAGAAQDGGAAGGQQQGGTGGTGGTPQEGAGGGQQKPWERSDYDPSRTDAELREARREAQNLRTRLSEREAADTEAERAKMDAQKRAESERDEAKGKLTKAESEALRLDVILSKAPETMTARRAHQLAKRLTGATREELEADAVSLFAEFGEAEGEGGGGKAGDEVQGKPRANLKGGANNQEDDDDTEIDLDKVPRY